MILLTGFGAFEGVAHNPAEQLARALDGAHLGSDRVVGLPVPVLWDRAAALTVAVARAVGARAVIGLGIARGRLGLTVERVGRPARRGVDARGVMPDGPLTGWVHATADVEALARHLGAALSDDAGAYVCNDWVHQVTSALSVPVAFVHLPGEAPDAAAQLSPQALHRALAAWWAEQARAGPRASQAVGPRA